MPEKAPKLIRMRISLHTRHHFKSNFDYPEKTKIDDQSNLPAAKAPKRPCIRKCIIRDHFNLDNYPAYSYKESPLMNLFV